MMREGVKEPDFDGNLIVSGQCFYLLVIIVKASAYSKYNEFAGHFMGPYCHK
jgi:hypothetical protein